MGTGDHHLQNAEAEPGDRWSSLGGMAPKSPVGRPILWIDRSSPRCWDGVFEVPGRQCMPVCVRKCC
jgi:hypothetical protein